MYFFKSIFSHNIYVVKETPITTMKIDAGMIFTDIFSNKILK